MENPVVAGRSPEMLGAISTGGEGSAARKEKRKALKKLKRKRVRQEIAIREKELEEARANDPEEQIRLKKLEEEERERVERERKEFEERERIWIEAKKRRDEVEEAERQRKLLEDSEELDAKNKEENLEEDEEFEYVEEGPAEIIWKGNEIIVKKKTVKVPKKSIQIQPIKENLEKPTSNPLPPNPESFPSNSAQEILEKIAQETPNFGTELDKAHCPFQLKTGACRFGTRCNRLHFYPEKSCTLLVKNMYNGPGLSFEQDEGLEYTDEEIEKSYEEFYEDVHTEFLKFGELVNFKVCRNGSYHLRGNVYVHYKSLDSALLAFNHINCRFFAGKQISCEFVGVTRWKVAICGEYMKTRLKTCSRGSACNFIHCFRNPCGDYEWANFDNPPPKSWIRKMVSLFGFSDQSYCASKALESNGRKTPTPTNDSRSSRRREYSRSRERSYERQRDFSSRTHEERHNSRDGNREKERKFESKREKERRMELSIDEERYNGGVYTKRDFDLEKEYFEIKSEREKQYREYSVERETNGDESEGKFSRKSRKEKHERIDSDKHDSDLGSKKHRKRESSRKKRDEFFESEEREENDHYDYREYKRSKKGNYEDKSSDRHKIRV